MNLTSSPASISAAAAADLVQNVTDALADMTTQEPDLSIFNATFFYLVGVAGTVVCVIGIAGNSLSISVLSHVDLTSATTTYLLMLAVYDVLFLVARLLAVNGEWLVYGITKSRVFQLKYTSPVSSVLEPVGFVLGTGSIFATVALTIDRCIAVVVPLRAGVICSKRKIHIVLLIVFVFSVIVNVPLFLETRLKKSYDTEHNVTFLDRVETDYRQTEFHTNVYLLVLYPIFKTFAPAAIIVLCNSVIAGTVLRAKDTNMTTSDTAARVQDAYRLTAQVVFISLVTLLSRIFEALTFVMMEVNDTVFYDACPTECFVVAAINEFLVTFNSAANFVCYCYFGRKFRQILYKRLDACGLGRCCPCLLPLLRKQLSSKGSQISLSSVIACQTTISMADT